MSSGRIQSLLIASRGRHVVYERFYDVFSEVEKSEIRSAFDETLSNSILAENQEIVGRYKNGKIVGIPSGEIFVFGLGTGEYNELALCEVLQTLISIYKELFKVPALSDTILFQNYSSTILVIDEIIKEGFVEHLDKPSIQKALVFKLPFVGDGTDKKGIMSRLTSSS